MDFDKLMKEKEKQFDTISALMKEKTDMFNKEMTELEAEQLRIQGEYRMLAKLKEDAEAVEPVKEHKSVEKIEAEIVSTEE